MAKCNYVKAVKMKQKINKIEGYDIDLVYLWCDANDPNFANKKIELSKKINFNLVANDDCRYLDNEELLHSLRSVEKYASWIRNIYIVTYNQCPKWLNINHPKIKIIDHSEIMPKSAIPNFNSNAIEHCIVNIPELSEFFLYANDDMYISDYITPEFFFNKKTGYPIFRYYGYFNTNSLYGKMLKNSSNLALRKFGKKYERWPHHCIDAYRKSDILQCQKIFENEIYNTIHHPFRSENDVQRSIYSNYAMAIKHGHFKKVKKIDSYLPLYKQVINYCLKIYKKDSIYIGADWENITERIIKYRPFLFCINDNEQTTNEDRIRMKNFLDDYYPDKSSFEKISY